MYWRVYKDDLRETGKVRREVRSDFLEKSVPTKILKGALRVKLRAISGILVAGKGREEINALRGAKNRGHFDFQKESLVLLGSYWKEELPNMISGKDLAGIITVQPVRCCVSFSVNLCSREGYCRVARDVFEVKIGKMRRILYTKI